MKEEECANIGYLCPKSHGWFPSKKHHDENSVHMRLFHDKKIPVIWTVDNTRISGAKQKETET
jgi:hypothetical protein